MVFGIGVDYFRDVIDSPLWLDQSLAIVEDGGELLAIVLLLVIAYGTTRDLAASRANEAGDSRPLHGRGVVEDE